MELKQCIDCIEPISKEHIEFARKRQNSLLKPPGSLGKLESLSIQLAGIYRSDFYSTQNKVIIAFGADHGVHEEGISVQPQSVTADHFPNYAKGICSVGIISKAAGARVVAVDVGINTDKELEGVINKKIAKGTKNMAKEPAMTREEAIKAIEVGIFMVEELVNEGVDVIGLGEMGICNTTPSSAIASIITGKDPREMTGLGAGTMPDGLEHKINIIEKAIKLHSPNPIDGIEILSKVGGFEIGAIAGAILACGALKKPVVLDGFISYAGAMIAKLINPMVMEYVIASHISAEPASKVCLQYLGLEASLAMDMRLGEGTGAAMMFSIIETANSVYTNMLSFADTVIPALP